GRIHLMDARHAILFESVTVGPKTPPNRFYQVPHASGFGSAKPRTQAAFRAVKAEGGWGGVCVEYAPISQDSDETPPVAADIWDDRDARALGLAAEAIHAHGSLAGVGRFPGGGSRPHRGPRGVPRGPGPAHPGGFSGVGSPRRWIPLTSPASSGAGSTPHGGPPTSASTSSTCTGHTAT